jgi:IS4 transposase
LKQLPEKLILTEADTDDKQVLKRLIFKGFTYIFDRGFNCYTFFETIHTKQAFFLTRLCQNAVYTVEKTLAEATATAFGVLKDQLILLGQGETRIATVFRLITYRAADGTVYLFLTNRFDLKAETIADLYKFRWSIELFFRWMKRYLKFDRLIARNENGVLIQLYSALITFLLLTMYFKKTYGLGYPTIEALRRFRYTMHNVISDQDYNSYSVSFDSS